MLLSNGTILNFGETNQVISAYTQLNSEAQHALWVGSKVSNEGEIEINKVEVVQNNPLGFGNDEPLIFNVHLNNLRPLDRENYRMIFSLKSEDDTEILNSAFFIDKFEAGQYKLELAIPKFTLSNSYFKMYLRIDIPKLRIVIPETNYVNFQMEIIDHNFGTLYKKEPGGFFHLPLEGSFHEI